MKKKIFKIFVGIFIFCFIFLIQANVINAKTLSIDDIIKEFEQTDYVKDMSIFDMKVTAKNNVENKTIDIYNNGKKEITFKYSDDYIEYEDRETVITQENYSDNIIPSYSAFGMAESILKLSGYEDYFLDINGYLESTYEEYGIVMETEEYTFKGFSEDGSWIIFGEFLRYFKISLDTEKIDKLVEKYGFKLEIGIKVGEITESSIALFASIPVGVNEEIYENLECEIYRADKEDGIYEKIPDAQLDCSNTAIGYIDKGLKSNSTYYYKTKIVDSNVYSEPVKVTTKELKASNNNSSNSNNNSNNNAEVGKQQENPKTADINNNLAVLILAGSIGLIAIGKKKLKKLSK